MKVKKYKLVEDVEEEGEEKGPKEAPEAPNFDEIDAAYRDKAREIWRVVSSRVRLLQNGIVQYSAPSLQGSSFILLIRWIFQPHIDRPADGLRFLMFDFFFAY